MGSVFCVDKDHDKTFSTETAVNIIMQLTCIIVFSIVYMYLNGTSRGQWRRRRQPVRK